MQDKEGCDGKKKELREKHARSTALTARSGSGWSPWPEGQRAVCPCAALLEGTWRTLVRSVPLKSQGQHPVTEATFAFGTRFRATLATKHCFLDHWPTLSSTFRADAQPRFRRRCLPSPTAHRPHSGLCWFSRTEGTLGSQHPRCLMRLISDTLPAQERFHN